MENKEEKGLKRSEPARGWMRPLEEMERRFDEMEDWLGGFFGHPVGRPMRRRARPGFECFGEKAPAVDVFEEKDDLVIKAEVPGLEKENLEINVTADMVTISGEKKTEEKTEDKDYYFRECSTGSFTRQIPLPEGMESEKAKASFKDGVLEIRIPKSAEAKPRMKKITIQ